VSVAPDGTLWTLGFEMVNHSTKDPGVDQGAGILRHFDKSGRLIQSVLPQSGFTAKKQHARLSLPRIFATADRIYWFTSGSDEVSYAEISTSTFAEQTYPGVPISSAPDVRNDMRQVQGVGVTDNGTVYLCLVGDPSPYVRDSASGQWLPIQLLSNPKMPGHQPRLIGANGNELLFQSQRSAVSFTALK
jgi:hypothetical protein